MAHEYQTIKIRTATYRRLKIMAAEQGEKLIDLIDRLATREVSDTRSDTGRADTDNHEPDRRDDSASRRDTQRNRRA